MRPDRTHVKVGDAGKQVKEPAPGALSSARSPDRLPASRNSTMAREPDNTKTATTIEVSDTIDFCPLFKAVPLLLIFLCTNSCNFSSRIFQLLPSSTIMASTAPKLADQNEITCEILYAVHRNLGKLKTKHMQGKLLTKVVQDNQLDVAVPKLRERLIGIVNNHKNNPNLRLHDIFVKQATDVLDASYLGRIGYQKPAEAPQDATYGPAPASTKDDGEDATTTRKRVILKLPAAANLDDSRSNSDAANPKKRAQSFPLDNRRSKRLKVGSEAAESSTSTSANAKSTQAGNSNTVAGSVEARAIPPGEHTAKLSVVEPELLTASASRHGTKGKSNAPLAEDHAAATADSLRPGQPVEAVAPGDQIATERDSVLKAIASMSRERYRELDGFRAELEKMQALGDDIEYMLRLYFHDQEQLDLNEKATLCCTAQYDHELSKEEAELCALYQQILGCPWRKVWSRVRAQGNACQYRQKSMLESLIGAGVFRLIFCSEPRSLNFAKRAFEVFGKNMELLEKYLGGKDVLVSKLNTATYELLNSTEYQQETLRPQAQEVAMKLLGMLRPHVERFGRPFKQEERDALGGICMKTLVFKAKIDAYEGYGSLEVFWPAMDQDLDRSTMYDRVGVMDSRPRKIDMATWPGIRLVHGEDVRGPGYEDIVLTRALVKASSADEHLEVDFARA